MSPAKQRLLELEKSGKYFFHGSPNDVEIFEPRQSHNDVNGTLMPDGSPAISASPAVDYAILMAIFNLKNCPKGFSSKTSTNADSEDAVDFKLTFFVNKLGLEQINEDSSGWVYVFDRNDFPIKKSLSEYRSSVSVKAIERILVKKEDLPPTSELKIERD